MAGIIFLGTPFQGSDAATYGKWLAQLGRLNATLMGSLEKDSPSLHALSLDFWHSYDDWDMLCFYENKDAEYGPWKTRVQPYHFLLFHCMWLIIYSSLLHSQLVY